MACLNLSNGKFTEMVWNDSASTSEGDVTINRTSTSIQIQKTGFAASLNLTGDYRYVVYGSGTERFVVLVKVQESLGSSTRTVYMLDATGTGLTTTDIHSQGTEPNSVALPTVARNPGSASLLFVWSPTSTLGVVNSLSIVRSDNGDTVLSSLGRSNINGTIEAEVTASQLIIHHPQSIGPDSTAAPHPEGSLSVNPSSRDFGEAVLGGADPSLATVTRSFDLENDGDDCLTVSGISSDAPFSLTTASLVSLPIELDPNETRSVDVLFAPTAAGTYNGHTLNITRTPANGDSTLTCSGEASDAEAEISVSRSSIAFGSVPHPNTVTETFTVSNTGQVDVTFTIAGAPAGSAFTWTTATAIALPASTPGSPSTPFTVTVTFVTPGDTTAPGQTITVTPSAGAARTVTLTGAGCVANAEISPPAIAPLDFAQIERGFRTVRFIEITNTGDAELSFRARIVAAADPAHAALFGIVLPDNDITDAPSQRIFTVLPSTRCGSGATGTNQVTVAVGFYADSPSGSYSANLVIDQHNADNVPAAQTWTYTLNVVITDPKPLDAVLVIDRSGSMNDTIGARDKMEAALAAGRLFVQLLRDAADDRAAVVGFDTEPQLVWGIDAVAGNRAALRAALGPASFTAGGATNMVGGAIVGKNAFTPHPSSPADLKKAMIVLTDGIENRCYQDGGATWYSITGRDGSDPPDGMFRPDGTRQDTDRWPTPSGIQIYGVGLGLPAQTDSAALDDLSRATGAAYTDVVELTGNDFFRLEKHFTQIFMEAVGLASISDPFFTINPGDIHEHEFDMFRADVNVMVVLYDRPGLRLPFQVVSPKGEVFSGSSLPGGFGVRFHSTDTARFVEIRFPKGEPERYAGRWKVVIPHEKLVCEGPISSGDEQDEKRGGGYVGPGFQPEKCRDYGKPVPYGIAIGAGSNLRMQAYVEPGVKHVGEPIRLVATIAEAGLPVTGATVTVKVETPYGATSNLTLRDDGASQDGQADDGEYGGTFLNTHSAGSYRFLFRAEGVQDGKPPVSWVREAERTKAVYDDREPPGGGGAQGDGGSAIKECCEQLLRMKEKHTKLLKKILRAID